jgi:hypothetical protein
LFESTRSLSKTVGANLAPGTLARLARGLTWLNDRWFHRNSVTFKRKVEMQRW